MLRILSICAFAMICTFTSQAQYTQSVELDTNPINGYAEKRDYIVGGVRVTGVEYLDSTVIKTIFGVVPGQRISLPYDIQVVKGMKTIWSQGLLEDLAINVDRLDQDTIYLNIAIKERPRFSFYALTGTTKNQKAELKEQLDKSIGTTRIVSEGMKSEIVDRVKKYYFEKGYSKATVTIEEQKDATDKKNNAVGLIVKVDRGPKVKINQINIVGNHSASDLRLKKKLSGTKEKVRISRFPAYQHSVYGNEPLSRKEYLEDVGYLKPSKTLEFLDPYFRYKLFSASKFQEKKYEEDKVSLIQYYNSIGNRDATILRDTIYDADNNNINIDIEVQEGRKYYFGNILWSGNTKYSDSILTVLLGIEKGDVYNRELLDSKIGMAPNMDGSVDIGSLYMDDGYLFFQANAYETAIYGDTIDFRIDISEGQQATINRVTVKGNQKTNDHVIRRELFTKPGMKFSRADIIRSVRQVSQLGYIDPMSINPVPKPNPADGTVDLEYNLTEKPADQIEVQAGYGGGIGFTGTAGITLNNFSAKNLFKKKEWDPIPMGDGQSLSLRWQSNGLWWNSANFSFSEPWLGGKKPIGFTFGLVYSRFARGVYGSGSDPRDNFMSNYGANVIFSKRLKWPDNSFIGAFGINYQNYYLKDFEIFPSSDFNNGTSNNLNFMLSLQRSSIDNPIFPRSGSNISLIMKFTPPFSLLGDKNIDYADPQKRYKWIEYHKYRFDAEWYHAIKGDLILRVAGKFGYLGYYNDKIGHSPFERFQVGGDGMTGFNFVIGRDIISQRGYDMYTQDATIFNKYTIELRYPFSLNPNSTIFGLAFFESGNAWSNFSDYNPFRLNRAAGLGIRMRLPMFGLLGFDYGFGFDNYVPGAKFSTAAKFTFMLGREPD